MELQVVVREEHGVLWSEVPELPGCFASGATLSELRDALAEAIGLYLWDLPAQLDGELSGTGRHTITVRPVAAWPGAQAGGPAG
ncbi:MAG TPA: type II toxin-antitoxin system HicB family antitoxin [Solirubrobacteraceae bacterium]|nr:type II toxin-antitoxin system HicB family antitoxin [Solirubrobacteraceae bacterium]